MKTRLVGSNIAPLKMSKEEKKAVERTEQEKHVRHSRKSNVNAIGGSRRKKRDTGAEAISEEMMAKNFPN